MLNLQVIEVQHYTDKLFRIRTERPRSYRFTAGEFVMIGLDDAPSRAYSITSGPYDDYLEFYSIKVQDGPLTSRLQHITVGDTIKVGEKPTGTLILANLELGGDLVMMASGTGVAPFISLLRDPETYDLFDNITVTWTTRLHNEQDCYREFLTEMPIEYISTVTQEPAELHGRIQQFMADGTVSIDNPVNQRIMLCGSIAFNNDLKDHFTALGFSEGNKKTQGTFVQERAFVN
jgi:ferredoxin/flavodoxin---NADP+ reductase|tara:strand:+ start:2935 stop:3633 length:699 start_codon:yes stop_codon:yes gene_type:complete